MGGWGISGGKKGGEFKEVAGDETFRKFEKGLSEPSLAKPDLFYQKKKKKKSVEMTEKPAGKFWKDRGRCPWYYFFCSSSFFCLG